MTVEEKVAENSTEKMTGTTGMTTEGEVPEHGGSLTTGLGHLRMDTEMGTGVEANTDMGVFHW